MATIGKLLEKLAAARVKVVAKKAELAKLETEYDGCEKFVLDALLKSGVDKATGADITASVLRSLVPHVQDWGKVERYIVKADAFDLLQRRMGALAWRTRYESGILVPGTVSFERVSLGVTPLKKLDTIKGK